MDSGSEQLAGCVLWHEPNDAPAPELLAALGRKHIEVLPASDRYAALAHACRLRDRGGVVVVLLHEPDRLYASHAKSMVAEFLESVALYLPASTVWAYEASNSPELRAFGEDELEPEIAVPAEDHNHASASAWGRQGGARSQPVTKPVTSGRGRSAFASGVPELRLVEAPEPDIHPDIHPNTQPDTQHDVQTDRQPEMKPDRLAASATDQPYSRARQGHSGQTQDPRDAGPELTDDELAALLGLDRPALDADDSSQHGHHGHRQASDHDADDGTGGRPGGGADSRSGLGAP